MALIYTTLKEMCEHEEANLLLNHKISNLRSWAWCFYNKFAVLLNGIFITRRNSGFDFILWSLASIHQ